MKLYYGPAGTTTRQQFRKVLHQLMHLRPSVMGYVQYVSRQCTKSNAWTCAQLESPSVPSDLRAAANGGWDSIPPEAQVSPLYIERPHFLPGLKEENWVDMETPVDIHFLIPSNWHSTYVSFNSEYLGTCKYFVCFMVIAIAFWHLTLWVELMFNAWTRGKSDR